jgi:hypothetical protein
MGRKAVKIKTLSALGVCLAVAASVMWAQDASTAPSAEVPVLTTSQANCTGFIKPTRYSGDVWVWGAADNDNFEPYRSLRKGEYAYLRSKSQTAFAEGAEYRIVRPANYLFGDDPRYDGEMRAINHLGQIYEDVGIIKVEHVTAAGAVAQVTFSCGPVFLDDLAVPMTERVVPTYTPVTTVDRFGPPDHRKTGLIVAAKGNDSVLGNGSVVYVNIGTKDGIAPGQRFRVIHNIVGYRDHNFPRETLGEMVVVYTNETSSVGAIVDCTREIKLRDMVEAE